MLLLLAVLTRDRPQMLARCLRSVARDAAPSGWTVALAVIDDGSRPDALAQARALVGAAVGPFPARLIEGPGEGIAPARNRALDEAAARGADALAFLDDDQTIDPGWLGALIAAQAATGADVVKSGVDWEFEPPGRLREFFASDYRDPAAPRLRDPGASVATNGVLITRRLWDQMGLRFDPRLARTGGEDTLFFREAHALGARATVTLDARAVELCPAAKQRLGWVLRRAYRVGCVEAFIDGKGRGRVGLAARGALRCLWALTCAPALAWSPPRARRKLVKAAKAAGLMAGGLGLRFEEYRTVIGR